MALIFPFVARLTKVQVKTIGNTVTSRETNALVETLIKIKGWWRSTQSITRVARKKVETLGDRLAEKRKSYFSTL